MRVEKCASTKMDCWDGQKKTGTNDFADIVIYHGYTMTSKILLRDVLHVIRHYAFVTSEYPVILSIEDNCSVPAQRLLAQELKEILGDYLLTQPHNRDEKQLPSPAALKKKIIVKHKKLPVESEDLAAVVKNDEFQDTEIIARECVKKGILSVRNNNTHEWTSHVFILFPDRLCYLIQTADDESKDDTASVGGDEEREEETRLDSEFDQRRCT
uniref:PLCXc domain-containing protein n=1 Tax=Caenorhabditis japonica TaxID=281687 RepID=A0A8R1EKM8_CAEJA